ncbi:MAG TPA: hypothetical protein VGN19_05990 [Pedococcus sp.]|nr:hypothetical protein [Pedococcus sp.]
MGRQLAPPRLWFVTVRVSELAAVALVVGAALELWTAFQTSAQIPSADGTPGATPSFMRRIVTTAFYSGVFRTPLNLVLAALLVGFAVGVLVTAKPVWNARLLRWEVLATWGVVSASVLTVALINTIAMFGDSPFASTDPSVVSVDAGPSLLQQGLTALAWPVAAGLVLVGGGLWWLRLSPETDPVPAPGSERRVPDPPAQGDGITIDGVEQIEPVDRSTHPEAPGGNGATTSGYEDYFRRF